MAPALILKEVSRVLRPGGLAVFSQEPFLPVYLLPMQFLYSRPEKKTGVCERVFSLRGWLSFAKDFEIIESRIEGPAFLKGIVPDRPFIYKYITGGGLSLILRKNKDERR